MPFRDLTPEEKKIVFEGPAVKKHILYRPKNGEGATPLDFTFFNAVYTVENALSKVKDEKGMKRVERFLRAIPCPDCEGTRLSAAARVPEVAGITLDAACRMTLRDLALWVDGLPETVPESMRTMAENLAESFRSTARRLMDLGLSYLTLDRSSASLSTGERQRMQLARAVRNRTTGVLYVLDEPSIGLHPANLKGLTGVIRDLVSDGNSVLLVDHDASLLSEVDHLIELGPGAGVKGGRILTQGPLAVVRKDPASKIAPYLTDHPLFRTERAAPEHLFDLGRIHLETGAIHTVKPLSLDIPKGRLTVVTGVSGSGKTTLVLESLVPALEALTEGKPMPDHVRNIEAEGIRRVKLIDATPVGINVRSTVATYANVHDEWRKLFARTKDAKARGKKAGDFSYNTGSLRCPECDGTGVVTLDVQFLPDVEIPCPACRGSRYAKEAETIFFKNKEGERRTLPQLMASDVHEAVRFCRDEKTVAARLKILDDLGLGYLTLGEATPALSGGEAQRLKLASEMGRGQGDAVFVFDEPTIGLHPEDVKTLVGVFDRLLAAGATVVVIEHDLDVIRSADYVVDLGPGGGEEGGRIVACGAPEAIRNAPESRTGRFL